MDVNSHSAYLSAGRGRAFTRYADAMCIESIPFAGFKLIIAEVRQGPEPVAVDTAASSGQ